MTHIAQSDLIIPEIAADFSSVAAADDRFVADLAARARSFRSQAARNPDLKKALEDKKQRPTKAIYFNGRIPGTKFVGSGAAQAFCASCVLMVPDHKDVVPRTIVAAAEFAKGALKITNHLMIYNSDSDDLDEIKNGERGDWLFSGPWLRALEPVLSEVRESSIYRALRDKGPQEQRHYLNQEILIRSASNLESLVDILVTPMYFNADTKVMTAFGRATKADRFKPILTEVLHLPQISLASSKNRCLCSCCDSRALGDQVFNAQSNEFYVINNIANIIQPHAQAHLSQLPSSAWATLESAYRKHGTDEFALYGHDDCGGIKYAVSAVLENAPVKPDSYVDAWVRQIVPDVAREVEFAKSHSFFNGTSSFDRMVKLATIHNARRSAKHIKDFAPDARVLPLHFEFDLNLYPLPEMSSSASTEASLHQSAQCVMALEARKLPNLSDFDYQRQQEANAYRRGVVDRMVETRMKMAGASAAYSAPPGP